ncbi:adhesion G-protein coupled receptor F3 [Alosa sapidissima]|uniref:adhesion G-protein coupled receptor F3 n=1 Tax=Alosa sapidissima TaxID=34773 RepID=UPI001C08CD28|nr:adhesion G-protein coupled receptor F3 [Alosa sapidissima]
MELFLSMSLNFFLLFNAYITSAENYYQTLNAVISIEDKANDNLTDLLRNFIASSGKEVISQISRTKDCHLKNGEINCVCEALFSKKDGVECNPVNRVSVNGTIVHGKKTYSDDLTNPNTDAFKELSNNIIQEFSKEYSKLKWFNSLTITKFSKGSVKIHFRMTFDTDEGIEGIDNITAELQKEYGKAELVTEGFVRITAPTGRVEYNTNVNLSCETNANLTGDAAWYLRRENGEETEIYGGTEVELKNQLSKSTIHLSNTSSVWRGSYICEFKQGTVKHQASVFLDVALLPKINIFTDPQFPDCKKPRPTDKVTVTCAIENTTEIYNVNWEDKDFTSPNKKFEHGNLLYSIVKTVVCTSKEDIKVSCNFTNNLNQFKPEYLTIPVIYSDTKVCPKDGDWPEAKAGYVAKLPCGSKQKGERTRECQKEQGWDKEIPECVNLDLGDISERALDLQRGLGKFTDIAPKVFEDMKKSTQGNINSRANLNTSVLIFKTMYSVSLSKNESIEGESLLTDILTSASNIINDSLKGSWDVKIAADYLIYVNGLLGKAEVNDEEKTPNINHKPCNGDCQVFNVTMTFPKNGSGVATGYKTLGEYLPLKIEDDTDLDSRGIVLQINAVNTNSVQFKFSHVNRTKNHKLHCVVWNPSDTRWSEDGCTWGGASNPEHCECELPLDNNVRSSESSNRYKGAAFTVLMAKNPVIIPYIEKLTWVGLFVSVVSLFVCLMIEFAVWNAVVKSSIAHFRHTAVVNISLCLLLADSSFLATAFPESTPSQWCRWLVVMKHYCFLAMFFWMLCLSLVLLHSLIFIFHRLRKKVYLGASFTVGYVCPLIIVVLTVIAYDNGKEDSYYLPTTCWLKYEGAFQGSFFAFVMPVGIIVAINVLSMLLVIAKLLTPSISEGSTPDDKEVIRGILKAVIFLTPIFGVTWAFGFAVLAIDHTVMPMSKIVNYAFTVCNAFQGLFILLTACLGEKKVRDQLSEIMRCNSKVYKTSRGELSTSKTSNQSSIKKK